jgi:hypothetical protein
MMPLRMTRKARAKVLFYALRKRATHVHAMAHRNCNAAVDNAHMTRKPFVGTRCGDWRGEGFLAPHNPICAKVRKLFPIMQHTWKTHRARAASLVDRESLPKKKTGRTWRPAS